MSTYGVIKFQAPFEKMKEYDFTPEIRLNKAIILQAIIDASNVSDSKLARKVELEAKQWLFGNSADFLDVCHRANSNPSHVIRTAKKIIRLNHESRESTSLTPTKTLKKVA
ncbi:MAG: hypothetical protein Tsb006_7720 [Rickettsiaceae bacterium]